MLHARLTTVLPYVASRCCASRKPKVSGKPLLSWYTDMVHALTEKAPDCEERLVKIGLIQLAGLSLDVAERFMQEAVSDRPDVVVLPEVGCGREPLDMARSRIVAVMREHARQGSMYVVLNVTEANGARTFNTTLILGRDGSTVGCYRKVHIPLASETDCRQDGGDAFPVFDLDFGRAGVQVCFDNYWPEAVRSLALAGAEIVFFPHQEHFLWNEAPHMEILARARAIENVLYMVPCGPTAAEDGVYGRTGVIDPTGKYVFQLPPKEEGYGSTTVDLGLIDRVSIDGPGRRDVPMREQMLTDASEAPLRGRRRPDAYSLLTQEASR